MQASRLLSILLLLQTRGRMTARALADAFEVSIRTVYRDIDELSAAGVPVYAEKGRNGGFQLMDGYRTRLTGLDRGEAETLFLSGLPGAAAQLGLGEAMTRTRLKLMAALPDQAREDAERVAGRFHLDPVAWFQGPDEQAILPELALAVWTGRRVRMRYQSWKGLVSRQGAALGLVLKAGLWYAVMRVDGQVRSYRVSSIMELEIGEPAEPADQPFDLPAYWAGFCADYEQRMQQGRATVRARPEALKALARRSHAMARAVAAAGPADPDGWRTAQIPIESVEDAVGELLHIGPDLEAVAPPELRAGLIEAIDRLRGLYGRPRDH